MNRVSKVILQPWKQVVHTLDPHHGEKSLGMIIQQKAIEESPIVGNRLENFFVR